MAQKHRRVLEPVLENYSGSPDFDFIPSKPQNGSPITCKKSKSKNLFRKLRDRYIKLMNEMVMGGDFAAVAGYHGCVAETDYPGTMGQYRSGKERELEALQRELAML